MFNIVARNAPTRYIVNTSCEWSSPKRSLLPALSLYPAEPESAIEVDVFNRIMLAVGMWLRVVQ